MELLSIIVPFYNEEETLCIFIETIEKSLNNINYEIIFVNDGSNDDTLGSIKKISKKNLI